MGEVVQFLPRGQLEHEPDEWIRDGEKLRAKHGLPEVDLKLEADKFFLFWTTKTGAGACKVQWRRTWLNWCKNARPSGGRRRRDPSDIDVATGRVSSFY